MERNDTQHPPRPKPSSASVPQSISSQPTEEIFQQLRADHQKVSRLFQQMTQDGANDWPEQRRLFKVLKACLESHSQAEERVVYAELEKSRTTQELALISEQEHAHIQELIDRLASLVDKSANEDYAELMALWEDTLWELKSSVEEHVAEEESETFEQMRAFFSGAKLLAMAKAFQHSERPIQAAA